VRLTSWPEGKPQTWYGRHRLQRFADEAPRFAAKEAAFKAHPHRRLGFHDVLILSGPDARQLTDGAWGWAPGVPTALIKAPRGSGGRDQLARVSISHDGEYATATCIGFEADADALRDTDGRGEPRKGWLSWLSRLWR
jgi:phosphopantetheinyl transferase (holo-ACP synthase)